MENFKKQDQKVIDMVNKANQPEPEAIEKPRLDQVENKEKKCRHGRSANHRLHLVKIKAIAALIVKVMLCAATSLLFSLILVRPECVEPVAHLGIVIAGAVAAVHVDRFITRS